MQIGKNVPVGPSVEGADELQLKRGWSVTLGEVPLSVPENRRKSGVNRQIKYKCNFYIILTRFQDVSCGKLACFDKRSPL